nr:MAG TPA: HNH endonuclease [Caudoviricetes sp.]
MICRRCNQSRGSNVTPKLSKPRRSSVDVDW